MNPVTTKNKTICNMYLDHMRSKQNDLNALYCLAINSADLNAR